MIDRLYHYTSLGALIEIVKSRVLWASNIHYLNDDTEFQYALRLLHQVLVAFERLQPTARPRIERLQAAIASFRRVNVCVASFSVNGDLLSQWRAYCPPARGVAVGVSVEALREAARRQDFVLEACLYDEHDQNEIVKVLVADALGSPIMSDDEEARMVNAFIVRFTRTAATIKHPSFFEEQEWRLISGLVATNDPKVKYREGRSTIVPYFEFDLPRNAAGQLMLDHFILGPTPSGERSLSTISALCSRHDVAWKGTQPSRVPFRPW